MDGANLLMTKLIFSDEPYVVCAGVFFIIYLCITALMIMQMLIGVLCQVIVDVDRDEKDKRDMAEVRRRLHDELVQKDRDGNNEINRAELIELLEEPHSLSLMRDLNINVLFL